MAVDIACTAALAQRGQAGQIKPKSDWNGTTTKTIWFPQKGNHLLPNNILLVFYCTMLKVVMNGNLLSQSWQGI